MAAGRRAANVQGDQSTGSPSIPDARRMPARARPVTMKDVAAATGVSRSTVSRILNDAPLTVPVSAATRTRVLAAARELEYRPNPLARALRGAPTMLLGAIVRDITDPFFAGAIETVSVAARARGYNVVLGHAHGEATKAHELAALLEAGHCDAILMMGDMSDQPRLLEDLRDTHIPVVALWQGSELRSIPAVNVDNQAGVTATMAHLVELGHRRIAFIGGRLLGDIQERQQAYAEAMASIGAEVITGYIQRVDNTAADGGAALAAVMALPVPPTAVVAATDVLAIGILRGAYRSAISVPADLSVVGFDDIAWAATTVPALTTVRMPTAEMATAAVNLAILLAGEPAGEVPAAEHVQVFRPEIVVRESTAPPAATPGTVR